MDKTDSIIAGIVCTVIITLIWFIVEGAPYSPCAAPKCYGKLVTAQQCQTSCHPLKVKAFDTSATWDHYGRMKPDNCLCSH